MTPYEILQSCCRIDDLQGKLDVPFRDDQGRSYASNGALLIRISGYAPLLSEPHRFDPTWIKRFEKLFDTYYYDCTHQPVPRFVPPASLTRECTETKGIAADNHPLDCYCDGTGKIDVHHRLRLRLADLDWRTFSLLLPLKNLRFAERSEAVPVSFIFEGGRALIMPLAGRGTSPDPVVQVAEPVQ